jgi:hypothetical protein
LVIKEVSEIYMTDFGLAIATKVDERFISSKLKECKERVIYEHACIIRFNPRQITKKFGFHSIACLEEVLMLLDRCSLCEGHY